MRNAFEAGTQRYPDLESWERCDATKAQLVKGTDGRTSRSGGDRHVGGGCYESHEFDCLGKSAGFQAAAAGFQRGPAIRVQSLHLRNGQSDT